MTSSTTSLFVGDDTGLVKQLVIPKQSLSKTGDVAGALQIVKYGFQAKDRNVIHMTLLHSSTHPSLESLLGESPAVIMMICTHTIELYDVFTTSLLAKHSMEISCSYATTTASHVIALSNTGCTHLISIHDILRNGIKSAGKSIS